MPPVVHSFAPVAAADARVLVLGSMPGLKSLQVGQYYAHPRNLFWAFMGELVGADPALPYPERCNRLTDSGIAVWDVLSLCERPGSLDSAIRDDTAQANDFAEFFARHPRIGLVLFNGAKAESSFARLAASALPPGVDTRRLPSTSPANASQRPRDKLEQWRSGLLAAGIRVADHTRAAAAGAPT